MAKKHRKKSQGKWGWTLPSPKPPFPKERAELLHAQQRALERYGLELTEADLHEIARSISNPTKGHNKHRVLREVQSWRIRVYDVTVQGQRCHVVYDRNRKTLVTFLPKEWEPKFPCVQSTSRDSLEERETPKVQPVSWVVDEMVWHAQQRAYQRYGIVTDRTELARIAKRICSGGTYSDAPITFVKSTSRNRGIYKVLVQGQWCHVVCDRGMRTLVTFLRKDWSTGGRAKQVFKSMAGEGKVPFWFYTPTGRKVHLATAMSITSEKVITPCGSHHVMNVSCPATEEILCKRCVAAYHKDLGEKS